MNSKQHPFNLQSAAAAAFVSGVLLVGPQNAQAVDFNHNYSDPYHPNCLRSVVVSEGSALAQVSGTDGTPGCPSDGSGRPWR